MPRPFLNKTTVELAGLFTDCGNSRKILQQLADELSYRRVPSARLLLTKVKAALAAPLSPADGSQPTHIESSSGPPPDNSTRPKPTGDAQARRRERAADYATPPTEFTTVQPMGVLNRPNAFRPVLQNDVRLEVGKNEAQAKVFRVALSALIREMKSRRLGTRQFSLEEGEQVGGQPGGFSYQFDFTEEANLFEGAKVDIIVGGRSVGGHLTALLAGRIIVTLQEDFGPIIRLCVLRIDNTALLQALHDRLQKIESGEVPAFRAKFAASVLENAGQPNSGLPVLNWPPTGNRTPNSAQRKFVGIALANEIAWLWGPPGTGKTDTLSALVRILYDKEKRVLVCSNTNQAVDQLLLQLCRNITNANESALKEGRVLRLGRLENDELRDQFGEFITMDAIVTKKSEGLLQRKADIDAELERLGRSVAYAEQIVSKFRALDTAQSAISRGEQELASLTTNVKSLAASLRTYVESLASLASELLDFQNANALRRMFRRSEIKIRQDITAAQTKRAALNIQLADVLKRAEDHKAVLSEGRRAWATATSALAGENRSKSELVVANYENESRPLRQELATITAKLEDISNSVLKEAKIVGATVTRTYLRPLEFAGFDAVIIDEASMILQPAVFHAAGLALERVVIAGDFQQLPPIVQTQQQEIHDALAPDVFERAGIRHETVFAGAAARVEMLTEQFRMDEVICRVVSNTFYGCKLVTSIDRKAKTLDLPEPFSQRLTIVDTSSVWPFTTRDSYNSRLNLMHALAVRNLMFHLQSHGCLTDGGNKSAVGVCTPYSAQAKLLKAILKAHGLESVRASTAHGFQGDEREVVVLDLVDSVGEWNAGFFLQATQRSDSGAKLFNVALSRAKEAIVVFANLTFLDQKLPGDSILRGLLHDMQCAGRIIDVREVLALHPIFDDLKHFGQQAEIDPEALRTGLFGGRDFARLVRRDILDAKKSIIIFSGFITSTRAAQMGDVLRGKVNEGVRVRCVTRPPRRNGSISEDEGRNALASLEAIGSAIDLRNDIHEKVVVVDNRIVWFGSLNPLSHTIKTSELMARIDNQGFAAHLANVLAVRRQTPEQLESGSGALAENPRCEKCSGWTVLVRGGNARGRTYGPFFGCETEGCDWKQNVDAPRGRGRGTGRK